MIHSFQGINPSLTKKLLGVITLSALALSTHAGTISYDDIWRTVRYIDTDANTDNKTDQLTSTDFLSLPQFNASIGILNSVNIMISNVSITTRFYATFRDPDGFSSTSGLQRLNVPSITLLSLPGVSYLRIGTTRFRTCSDSFGFSSSSCSVSASSFTNSYSTVSGNIGDIRPYIGTGNLMVAARQTGTLFTNETDGGGFVDSRFGSISSGGTVKVTYDYTPFPPSPVPLPAAVWLFGSALLGLVGLKRKVK